MVENTERYVTKAELLETKIELKQAFEKDTDEIKKDLKSINEIVLPMAKWLEGIEGNTKRMATLLDEKNKTDKEFSQKLNDHAQEILELKSATTQKTERTKVRGSIAVALIGLVGGLATILATVGDKLASLIFG